MIGRSILSETVLGSELASNSILNPTGSNGKRSLFSDLLLTALIDAFSILVIFLLMSFSSTGDILFLSKGTELPKAAAADMLDRNTVVKFEGGKFFLEDKEISQDSLVAELLNARTEWQKNHAGEEFKGILTIQADRRTKYESLNAVVLAMAHTGYSEIRFAVVTK